VPVLVAVYVLALIPFTPSIQDIQKAKTEQPSVVLEEPRPTRDELHAR